MSAIIAFVVSIFAPRVASIYLYFFSGWFTGVFDTKGWPILGFVFMPRTMLWYSAVANWYGGHWGFLQIAILIIAILFDLGGGKTTYDRKPYGCF
jgi:hypothetical protein